MNCVIKNRKRLPNGIKVLNITENGTLRILQGSENNNRNIQSRLQCQVHYGKNSAVESHEVNIKFTACTCKFSSLNLRTGETEEVEWGVILIFPLLLHYVYYPILIFVFRHLFPSFWLKMLYTYSETCLKRTPTGPSLLSA